MAVSYAPDAIAKYASRNAVDPVAHGAEDPPEIERVTGVPLELETNVLGERADDRAHLPVADAQTDAHLLRVGLLGPLNLFPWFSEGTEHNDGDMHGLWADSQMSNHLVAINPWQH